VTAVEIEGTSAVVTGAASGLGEATARALAERGVAVVVVDLDADKGEAVAQAVGGSFVRTDVTSADQVAAAVDEAVRLGPLRTLVNCAGIATGIRTVGRDGEYASAHPLDVFQRIVTVNLVGTFNCIRLAATAMSRTEPDADGMRGAVVNTASVAAFDGQVGQAAYSASKGGIVGMTLPVARDLAAIGVRVNTIAPGLIDTPIYDSFPNPEQFKEGLRRDVLFPHRLGTPAEFAALVLHLVTNAYMNAEVIRLDAGARLQPR
jgi:NAD(P)-dependent dehydrogenase (short-subunit alcohol dehydrogenase family)